MAEDVICLLDYLGWTGERSVHVVGISLGGMIAQGEPLSLAVFLHFSNQASFSIQNLHIAFRNVYVH